MASGPRAGVSPFHVRIITAATATSEIPVRNEELAAATSEVMTTLRHHVSHAQTARSFGRSNVGMMALICITLQLPPNFSFSLALIAAAFSPTSQLAGVAPSGGAEDFDAPRLFISGFGFFGHIESRSPQRRNRRFEKTRCIRGDVMGTTKIVMGTTRMVMGTTLRYCTKIYFWISGVGIKTALSSGLVSED